LCLRDDGVPWLFDRWSTVVRWMICVRWLIDVSLVV
jgi:hypothetical protein